MAESYWDNITNVYKRQTEKGLKEYKMVLEDNDSLSAEKRIDMLEEELVDGLMYLEHLKSSVKNELNDVKNVTNIDTGSTCMVLNVVPEFYDKCGEILLCDGERCRRFYCRVRKND